jgi:hypothetical protein
MVFATRGPMSSHPARAHARLTSRSPARPRAPRAPPVRPKSNPNPPARSRPQTASTLIDLIALCAVRHQIDERRCARGGAGEEERADLFSLGLSRIGVNSLRGTAIGRRKLLHLQSSPALSDSKMVFTILTDLNEHFPSVFELCRIRRLPFRSCARARRRCSRRLYAPDGA